MPGLSYFLKPRFELYRLHHQRLRTAPQPAEAKLKFEKRLGQARRTHRVRAIFFLGIYFSIVAAAVTWILRFTGFEEATAILTVIGTVLSSMTAVFVAGVFVCTRFLSYMEVDLIFYSQEARLSVGQEARIRAVKPRA